MSNFEKMKEWILQNGGYIHPHIYRKMDKNGVYGIYTQKPIKKRECLLKIPEKLIISPLNVENIDRKELGLSDVDVNKLKNSPHMVRIIINLLIQKKKGDDSFYRPLLDCLPTIEEIESYHPFFMLENEKKILYQCWGGFSEIFDYMANENQNISNFIQSFPETFRSTLDCSKESIFWGYFIYLTRAWGDGVIPYMDMFNHCTDLGNCKETDGKNKLHILSSKVEYYPEDQVYDSYGYKNIVCFACNYGFFDEDNVNVVFPLKLNYTGRTSLHFGISRILLDMGMSARVQNDKKSIYLYFENLRQLNESGKFNYAFTEQGITPNLMRLFRVFAIENYKELEEGVGTMEKANEYLTKYVSDLRDEIEIDLVNKYLEKSPFEFSIGFKTCLLALRKRYGTLKLFSKKV